VLALIHLRGEIFENYIISEYIKHSFHSWRHPFCYFWRDNTGNEIDLLVERGGSLYAVDSKSGSTANPDSFNNLSRFQKHAGISRDNCFLVYGGDTSGLRGQAHVASWRNMEEMHQQII